ncbi:MAG: hypothetical protein EOO08_14980 [Chitinophagaceae bacterium]|nr:MAG: hypothetical protein EOO08_14980 [Chitinophagaceae bacterium]
MRRIILLVEILCALSATAQEPDQLERSQERSERSVEEEPLRQDLSWRKTHPLSLNTAGAEALRTLPFVSELQVQSLIAWRTRMGALLVVEELAAIPYWDVETVRRVQPYVTTAPGAIADGRSLIRGGAHTFTLRAARLLTQTEAYRKGSYAGGPERLSLRYRYRKDDRLRMGVSMEKDPGESLRAGPDFTSVHLYWQGKGLLRTLALGDFTVNMGQGLIQWDAPAYGGGADLAALKRQGPFLQPALGLDEYRFSRGAGLTLQRGSWQLSAYASLRKLDGRVAADSGGEGLGSVSRSGYHRTASEIAARKSFAARAIGGRLQWERGAVRLGLQARFLHFSQPLLPGGKPYEYFEARGSDLRHASIDWGFTRGPAHFFGEAAVDGSGHLALVQGLLFSGGAAWDAAVLYRHLPPEYAAFDGNAVTRGSEPQNEEGLYVGLQLRPSRACELRAWADSYRFPWLRYGVDASGGGFQGGLQATWKPRKKLEASGRWRCTEDATTEAGEVMPVRGEVRRHSLRLQLQQEWAEGWRAAFRCEALWLAGGGANGFAQALSLHLPPQKRWRGSVQGYLFDTDDYAARIYLYNEGAGGGTVAALYGHGIRYSVITQYEASKAVLVSVQAIRTDYRSRPGDPPPAEAVTEARLQISCHW